MCALSLQRPPYIQKREDLSFRYGNDRYEGFCVDLLETLSVALGFSYEIYIVPDDRLGERGSNGNWDGLIWQLLHGVSVGCVGITACRTVG